MRPRGALILLLLAGACEEDSATGPQFAFVGARACDKQIGVRNPVPKVDQSVQPLDELQAAHKEEVRPFLRR